MLCDNRSCGFTQVWEVTKADGTKKRICRSCYLKEGWDNPALEGQSVLIEEEVAVNNIEALFRERVGQKTRWIYTQRAADALTELYRVHGSWLIIAKRIGVTAGNLSMYATNLRRQGFSVNTKGDLEPLRNKGVGAEGYDEPLPGEEGPVLVEIVEPLAESELVRLQRRRIEHLETILGNIGKLATEVLD